MTNTEKLLELLDEFNHAVGHTLECIQCRDCKRLLKKIQERYIEEVVKAKQDASQ